MKITNTSSATRHLHDGHRLITLAPGDTREIDLPDIALALAALKGHFFICDDQPAAPSENDEIQNLRSDARSRGIKVDNRWGAERLSAEINRALEGK